MRIALLAALLVLAGIGAAAAQQSGPATSQPAARADAACDLPTEALVVICADSTVTNEYGQFVGGTVYVQLADEGFVQFTRCDGLITPCYPAFMRAESTNQGDAMALGPVESD